MHSSNSRTCSRNSSTASTCKLQKSHVDYGKGEDCLENDSLLQLNEENDDSDEDNLSNNEEIEEQN